MGCIVVGYVGLYVVFTLRFVADTLNLKTLSPIACRPCLSLSECEGQKAPNIYA